MRRCGSKPHRGLPGQSDGITKGAIGRLGASHFLKTVIDSLLKSARLCAGNMDRLSIETYNNAKSGSGNAAANATANSGAGNSASSVKNFYLYDGRGSVSELTDMTGTVTAKYRYDDFGKLKEIQNFNTAEETGKDNGSVLDALGNLFGINKQEDSGNEMQTPGYHVFYAYNAESYNPNTEMQYLRARYYKPETANFLTEDNYLGDILKPLTLNRYNYCAGNPVNYKDPSGNSFGDFDEIEKL